MRNQKGFTLIELMIVVAILLIVVSIGVGMLGGIGGTKVVDLPAGQTLEQITNLYPLSYTTRLRAEGEPVGKKEFRETGHIWDTVVIFQER
jgi:prepilin-type N-terminal cleavage/methylation domain-containing protein